MAWRERCLDPIYYMGLAVGDLVKWIADWGIYIASVDGIVNSDYPQYTYAIVIEVFDRRREHIAIVRCICSESSFHRSGNSLVLRTDQAGLEVISKAQERK